MKPNKAHGASEKRGGFTFIEVEGHDDERGREGRAIENIVLSMRRNSANPEKTPKIVPYRNSTMGKIIMRYLSGTSQTLIFTTVNPPLIQSIDNAGFIHECQKYRCSNSAAGQRS